ncbi:hypothetical protein [Parashewanella curva]|nr:hypothetical protein [Parashewanella curva]
MERRTSEGNYYELIELNKVEPDLHKLLFVTLYIYGQKRALPIKTLLRGIGKKDSINHPRVAAILGDWEKKGFVIKFKTTKKDREYQLPENIINNPALTGLSWNGSAKRRTGSSLSNVSLSKRQLICTRLRVKK